MNIINGVGWQQPVISPVRSIAEAATQRQQQAQLQPAVASSGAATQQQSRGNTARQHADDTREEAFAKLKVQLQNPDVARREQASSATSGAPSTNAAQGFRDYMTLSPAEKIKLKVLNELGITEEEFDALPPEQREIIGRKIAELMTKETELQSLATLNAQIQGPALSADRMSQLAPEEAQLTPSGHQQEKDPSA